MALIQKLKKLIPWRIRHRFHLWMEDSLRPVNPSLYKLLKFGRRNLNTPQYWDDVWSTDTLDREYSELFRLVLARVPERARTLDVGCGVGNLSRLLRDQRQARVTALDFSTWACEQLTKDGFETVVSSLPRIPLPDSVFDVAVATEVMEHLDRPERTLAEMVRVVKPGGIIMCSVPNDTLHPHQELEHQQAFDRDSLAKMLRRHSQHYEILTGKLYDGKQGEFLLGVLRAPQS